MGKPGKCTLGVPRKRWKMDLTEIGCDEWRWMKLAQNHVKWQC